MSIEKNFSVSFIAALALREKQIQQNYRPIIAIHKWFARRPGTLFRGLLLSEFGGRPVEEIYYRPNNFEGVTIADPFMGGGTPLFEANRVGCGVIGADISPMAAWIVREGVDAIDLASYAQKAHELLHHLDATVGRLYKTRCPVSGREDADVKYFFWVKTAVCGKCTETFDLFPGYVVAEDARHPLHVLVCPECGELNEVADPSRPGRCPCGAALRTAGRVSRSRCACPHCGAINKAPFRGDGPPRHRLFGIEYHNPDLKGRRGRLFKRPDADDLERVSGAEAAWAGTSPRFVPGDAIPPGDESSRLHRWGYLYFRELFSARQLLGLEASARFIARVDDQRVRRALATNFSDLLRYQNMLCRYDTMALKSLDIFSIHGFPVGYVQVESNLLGLRNGSAMPVGSGGWTNIIEKYTRAKRYCAAPFEVSRERGAKVTVPIRGEWIGERRVSNGTTSVRKVDIRCASSTELDLPAAGLDGVFTDPPYFGMVQYGELMQFCYVWLRGLVGRGYPGFERDTTRHKNELTGNATAERDLVHFAEGLASVYARAARALKPGAPLVFTYHHNRQEAYMAVGVAVLDAGLTCSASLPCPAEMGGSIHIHGTDSSILDTVFVCRDRGRTSRAALFNNADELARVIERELIELRAAGMRPAVGDIRCIAFGHLTRMAIWRLRPSWDAALSTRQKLLAFREAMDKLATAGQLATRLGKKEPAGPAGASGLFGRLEREPADATAL